MSETDNIIFACPTCSTQLALSPADYRSAQGRTINCPSCEAQIAIAAPSAEDVSPPTPTGNTFNQVFGRRCTHCGETLPPSTTTCPGCGRRLKGPAGHAAGTAHLPGYGARRVTKKGFRLSREWIQRILGIVGIFVVGGGGLLIYNHIKRTAHLREEQAFYAEIEANYINQATWEGQIASLRRYLARYPMGRWADHVQDLVAELDESKRAAGFELALNLSVELANGRRYPMDGRLQILQFKQDIDDLRKLIERRPAVRELRSNLAEAPEGQLAIFDIIGEILTAHDPTVVATAVSSNGVLQANGVLPGAYVLYGAGTAGPNLVGVFGTLVVQDSPAETALLPEYYSAFANGNTPSWKRHSRPAQP